MEGCVNVVVVPDLRALSSVSPPVGLKNKEIRFCDDFKGALLAFLPLSISHLPCIDDMYNSNMQDRRPRNSLSKIEEQFFEIEERLFDI